LTLTAQKTYLSKLETLVEALRIGHHINLSTRFAQNLLTIAS
jgi:hypothetical protein